MLLKSKEKRARCLGVSEAKHDAYRKTTLKVHHVLKFFLLSWTLARKLNILFLVFGFLLDRKVGVTAVFSRKKFQNCVMFMIPIKRVKSVSGCISQTIYVSQGINLGILLQSLLAKSLDAKGTKRSFI